jgi:hypothetical protein
MLGIVLLPIPPAWDGLKTILSNFGMSLSDNPPVSRQ